MSFFTKTKDSYYGEHTVLRTGRVVGFVLIAILLIATFFGSFTIVPTGYTGIKKTFGQINPEPANPGFVWKIPFVQTIEKVNNKQQDILIEDQIWSESSERAAVYAQNVTVTYTISPEFSAFIASTVTNYRKSLVNAEIVSSAIKSATKRLNNNDVTDRSKIEPKSQESLQEALNEKYGIGVVHVNKIIVSQMDFEDSYNQAIAAKQNAQVQYEQQQIENQRSIEKATADAEVKRTQSQANADAKLIEAQAEAEANKMIADSITENILQNRFYEKWNGIMPQVVGSSGMMVNMPIG